VTFWQLAKLTFIVGFTIFFLWAEWTEKDRKVRWQSKALKRSSSPNKEKL